MDFENMMYTPALYQDIGSSCMMSPIMMMPGMYPSYGIGQLKPALSSDKFERYQQKNKEAKHTLRNIGIIGAVVIGTALLSGGFKKGFGKLTNLFKRIKTKTP